MPIKKSAKKRVRQNLKRRTHNLTQMRALKKSLKDAKKTLTSKTPDGKLISKAIAMLDKAAKNRIIHPNKADRLKSRIQKSAAVKKVKLESAKIKTVAKPKKSEKKIKPKPTKKVLKKVPKKSVDKPKKSKKK